MELLIPLASAVFVVWLPWFALRGSLIAGCLVYLLVASCFGYPFLHFELGPIPVTLDRLVIVGLAAVYLIHRALGRTDPKPVQTVDKLLVAFLGLLAFSVATHPWRGNLPGHA